MGNITKKEHFTPQMILKNHACKQKKKNNNKIQYFTYVYDKEKDSEYIADIENICHQRNLYELYTEEGIIDQKERNAIEKVFARALEPNWEQIIFKIINKKTLTNRDEAFIYLLFALQILRTPAAMNTVREWLEQSSQELNLNLSKNDIDRYTKLASFIWGESSPEVNWILYKFMFPVIQDKNLVIYRTTSENFVLNCSNPVLWLVSINSQFDFFFPITSTICLGLVTGKPDKEMNISKECVDFINRHNFTNFGRFICSSKPIKERIEDLTFKRLTHNEAVK